MLGDKLRDARLALDLSLAEVAERAFISTATLSRIERDKQTLELGLFLTLAGVLKMPPADFFDDGDGAEGGDPLVAKIASMKSRERTSLWKQLSEEIRNHRRHVKADVRNTALQVEEILAQADFLRSEIEAVQKTLKKR